MEQTHREPIQLAASSPAFADEAPTRHDGWTGERMARFCEVLSETGIVADACAAVGKSTNTAYATRRRNPLFAAAWEEALAIARNRLADALLARSLEGSVERYFRNGQLVGEKRLIDNRLGIAILKRLDKRFDTDSQTCSGSAQGQRPTGKRSGHDRRGSEDWDIMLEALRTGSEEALALALAEVDRLESRREAHEAHDPGSSLSDDDDDFKPDRVWSDDEDGRWWTDFPPPLGFDGEEDGSWGDDEYGRECSDEECALLDAAREADLSDERAEEEAERDSYFSKLKAGLPEPTNKPASTALAPSGGTD